MRTAVLIGGGGFIGTHLAEHLGGEGVEVHLADLRFPNPIPAGAKATVIDVREPLDPAPFPSAPDLVVNLAAVHREPGHEPHEYYDANVTGGHNAVRLYEDLGATDVVFVSSISVYGPTEEPLSEEAPPRPVSHYGKSKLQAEELHRAWRAAGGGRRLTIVRPAVIFGRGEGGNFTRLGGALQRRRFVYPGRKDAIKANGYVKDMVRSIPFMHSRTESESVYNFCSQEPYTLEQVVDAFCRAADLKRPRLVVPKRPMLLAGSIGDRLGPIGRSVGLSRRRIEKLVFSTNIRADRLAAERFEYRYDLEAALRDWYASDPVGEFV